MGARTKARKRALDILYSADVRQIGVSEALATAAERALSEPDREASWVYARQIVQGVVDHRVTIDKLIEEYSQGWSLARMPNVDRAIVRIAVWEILYNDDVPIGVAIDEAVEAAKTISTDDSSRFVNGLLAKIAETSGSV
jgi:N utilization substance protein B